MSRIGTPDRLPRLAPSPTDGTMPDRFTFCRRPPPRPGYEPSVDDLTGREVVDSGYCSRVPNFVVGRVGYGHIKFLGDTDVRWVDLDQIVKFDRHSIVVYEHEDNKPPVGQLNKTAEVTLVLRLRSFGLPDLELDNIVTKLRENNERQGAQFLSFDSQTGEWKFLVPHFSRFGLAEDEEDDTVRDDVAIQRTSAVHEESQVHSGELALSHSLPAHLGLDPVRMLMFQDEEEDEEFDDSYPSNQKIFRRDYVRTDSPSTSGRSPMHISPLQGSAQKTINKMSAFPLKKNISSFT